MRIKKGQIAGQIFVYIMGLVIIALVFLYGYSAIRSFVTRTDQVTAIQFKTRIESNIEAAASDYGSVKKLELEVPPGYEEVCFVDTARAQLKLDELDEYPIMKDSVESGRDANVFLITAGDVGQDYYVGHMTVDALTGSGYGDLLEGAGDYMLCITPANGKIYLRLEGKGDHTFVGEWV